MVDFAKALIELQEKRKMAKREKTDVVVEEKVIPLDDTAVDGGELLIELPADFEEQIELSNKPALEPGKYLATILNVLPKVSDKGTHASKGLMWSLVINKDPNAVVNGWNPDAGSLPYQHYTYIGKIVGGRLTETEKGGMTRDMGVALGLTGSFTLSAVKNRQIIVNVVHEASMDDAAALAQDPTHEVERYFPKVKSVRPYVVGGIKGQLNEYLADGSEAVSAVKTESETPQLDAVATPNW